VERDPDTEASIERRVFEVINRQVGPCLDPSESYRTDLNTRQRIHLNYDYHMRQLFYPRGTWRDDLDDIHGKRKPTNCFYFKLEDLEHILHAHSDPELRALTRPKLIGRKNTNDGGILRAIGAEFCKLHIPLTAEEGAKRKDVRCWRIPLSKLDSDEERELPPIVMPEPEL